MRFFILTACIGIAAGLIIGFLLWHIEEQAAPSPAETKEDFFTENDYPTLNEPLKEYFRQKFIDAWHENRNDDPDEKEIESGEARFRFEMRKYSAEIGTSAAEQRTNEDMLEEAIAIGGSAAILDLTRKGTYKPDEEDLEWELIDRCVTQRGSGLEVSGAVFTSGDWLPVAPGMTIAFEPGVYTLDEGRLRGEGKQMLPSDVTIQGAGMDATLVHLGRIGIKKNVERLALRNLTLDAGNHGLFSLRTGFLVVDLDHVRVVRFDAAHAGCDIFGAEEGILVRAADSEFMGGYGNHPGLANLFDGKPILARFNRCRFELLRLSLREAMPHGRVSFQECSFMMIDENPFSPKMRNVDFTSCLVESILPRNVDRKPLIKDFDELQSRFVK